MRIAILLGTKRKNNYSQKVANYILNQANQLSDIEVTFINPSDEKFSFTDDHQATEAYKQTVKEADAFILVFPEYNHMFPGTMKSMLDGAKSEYFLKPFLLCGVSDGIFGGGRACEALLPVIKAFGAYPLQRDIYVTQVDKKFNDAGELTDSELAETIEKRLEQLVEMAEKFNKIRD